MSKKKLRLFYEKEDGTLDLEIFRGGRWIMFTEDYVAECDWEPDDDAGWDSTGKYNLRSFQWANKTVEETVRTLISAGLCKVPRLPKKVKEALGL